MAVPIKIPDVGTTVDEVTIVQWLVEEGTEIVRGQKIAAIETDKAVVELESVAAGVLLKKCAAEGQDVTTGDIIAYVGEPGESIAKMASPETADSVPDHVPPKSAVDPTPKPLGATIPEATQQDSKPKVSPMVRNLAKQKGVNLDDVVGTGTGGVITRQDVLAAAKGSDSN